MPHTDTHRRSTDTATNAPRRRVRRTQLAADRQAAAELEAAELERENARLRAMVRKLRRRVRRLKGRAAEQANHNLGA